MKILISSLAALCLELIFIFNMSLVINATTNINTTITKSIIAEQGLSIPSLPNKSAIVAAIETKLASSGLSFKQAIIDLAANYNISNADFYTTYAEYLQMATGSSETDITNLLQNYADLFFSGDINAINDITPLLPESTLGVQLFLDSLDHSTLAYHTSNQVSKVSQWNDKSGNSYHVTQEQSARQPVLISDGIGGKPSLQFTQFSSKHMKMPSGLVTELQSTTENTIFVVHKMEITSTQVLLAASDSGDGASEYAIRNDKGSGGIYESTLARENGVGLYASGPVMGGPQTAFLGGDAIWVSASSSNLDYDSGTKRSVIYYNDLNAIHASDINRVSWSDINNIDTGLIGINKDSGGLQWGLQGEISEIIMYDRPLSLNEITTVFNYLSNKYNL